MCSTHPPLSRPLLWGKQQRRSPLVTEPGAGFSPVVTLTRTEFAGFALGESRELSLIDSSGGNRNAVLTMVGQARRSIDIVSRSLDRPIFNDRDVADAIRSFIVRSGRGRIRVLVRDPSHAIAHGHRLINAAQRLSTFIELRTFGQEHRNFNTALVIVDRIGTVVRHFGDRYEGEVSFNNPVAGRDWTRVIDEMWTSSVTDPNLRSIHT